jgi:hypothetical protein
VHFYIIMKEKASFVSLAFLPKCNLYEFNCSVCPRLVAKV